MKQFMNQLRDKCIGFGVMGQSMLKDDLTEILKATFGDRPPESKS